MKLTLLALIIMSCSKDGHSPDRGLDYSYGHDCIVLGDRLENPYKTGNITKALQSLYPTKADRVDVKTTDLYVRFLPDGEAEFRLLENLGLHLTDHPLDYSIKVDGDWYHDPSVPQGDVTWQYAVVPHDFDFPDVRYEVIDECYLSENDPGTRSDGIDWAAVEREAYILTGNDGMLSSSATKADGKVAPSGRITIVDEKANGGKPFGVAGVRISCNSFVKFDHAYTDRDGYYAMKKEYADHPERYRQEGKVSVRVILLKPGKEGDGVPSLETRWAQIGEELAAGENFADMAIKYSADSHAKDGGLWADVNPAEAFRPEIVEAIERLEVGRVSSMINLDGWGFIVKKESETKTKQLSFAEAYDKIAKNVREAAELKAYDEWIARLKDTAFIKIYPFEGM